MSDTIITRLARRTVAATEGMKGKSRDKATIIFWCGAVAALRSSGQEEDATWVERVLFFLIATRGYSEIESILREADSPAKQTEEV